jgi:hypothetical protein
MGSNAFAFIVSFFLSFFGASVAVVFTVMLALVGVLTLVETSS